MLIRSSHNWSTKSGTWDSLNISLIPDYSDYPVLSSIFDVSDFELVNCNNYNKITSESLVSTFVDDYILERFWNNPLKYIKKFNKAKYVMSPDFSLLIGMPEPMQCWQVYRNRLVGYTWQMSGIKVIPTISWSDSSSFKYCFKGVKYNSVVAVSNIGCRNESHKKYFDDGFLAMLEAINPCRILFMCNKKYLGHYTDDRIIYLSSYWDNKRNSLINT